MVNFERKETYSLQDLIEILRILRAPGGCPWDRAQTHLSDRRNFLEEAYEAAEAFDRDDPALMCEELGDMLMQVLFNIHIEEDAGRFTTDDVTDHICKKLIFRHPHVFGTAAALFEGIRDGAQSLGYLPDEDVCPRRSVFVAHREGGAEFQRGNQACYVAFRHEPEKFSCSRNHYVARGR